MVSWQYDFGDGNTLVRAVNTPFTHTYTAAGTYSFTLITTSALGCKSDTAKKTITISDKPVAPFSFAGTPCIGNTITFTSGYTNTTGTNWYWDFGDGQVFNTSAGNTATHIYTTAQTNITVKHVVSIAGSVCAADTTFTIIPAIHQNPVAAFSIKKIRPAKTFRWHFHHPIQAYRFGTGTLAMEPVLLPHPLQEHTTLLDHTMYP
ncbi:MAG: PKD domain-containing protein [Chitinophagaceae bacterium]|nr:PKD domain-containing protein [Chitinophagaceae bacterium]